MSIPTWLLSMSWNSELSTVSSSTATMWLVALPLLLALNKPKYSSAAALEKFSEGAITKASPWPPTSAYSETMAKANVVEKEETLSSERLPRKFRGEGWKAWPFCRFVLFVRIKRPLEDTVATPSRVRLASENPLKVKNSSLVGEEAASLRTRRRRRKRQDGNFSSMDG
ncbi:hypothetical protein ACMD2_22800 [Ananas comosus]|uniref:Uncharacterized protein n=1 Tax=Ananas comosus TaxID=4615 RepID=A0A199VRS0_ANACO|nr:hypothetical protein ACMD2_22800 [Ananas comosus]